MASLHHILSTAARLSLSFRLAPLSTFNNTTHSGKGVIYLVCPPYTNSSYDPSSMDALNLAAIKTQNDYRKETSQLLVKVSLFPEILAYRPGTGRAPVMGGMFEARRARERHVLGNLQYQGEVEEMERILEEARAREDEALAERFGEDWQGGGPDEAGSTGIGEADNVQEGEHDFGDERGPKVDELGYIVETGIRERRICKGTVYLSWGEPPISRAAAGTSTSNETQSTEQTHKTAKAVKHPPQPKWKPTSQAKSKSKKQPSKEARSKVVSHLQAEGSSRDESAPHEEDGGIGSTATPVKAGLGAGVLAALRSGLGGTRV